MSRKRIPITDSEKNDLEKRIAKMSGFVRMIDSFAARIDKTEIDIHVLKKENKMLLRLIKNLKEKIQPRNKKKNKFAWWSKERWENDI